jgi:hypothetical protein
MPAWAGPVVLVHVGAASTWVALAVHRLVGSSFGAAGRRWAVGAAGVTLLSGGWLLAIHLPVVGALSPLRVGLKLVLVAAVVVTGWWGLRRIEAVLLVGALAAGVGLAVAPGVDVPACDVALGRLAAAGSSADRADVARVRAGGCAVAATAHEGAAWLAGRTLTARGASSIAVVVDGSPRAAAFADAVAVGAGVPVAVGEAAAAADAVVVAVAPDEAVRAVAALGPQARTVVLAGWLLRPDVEQALDRPSLVFALPADPNGDEGRRYRSALREVAPAARPTGAGLAAFVAGGRARPALAASSGVGVLPASLAGGHATAEGSAWLPGRALVTVARGDGPEPAAPARPPEWSGPASIR